MGYRLTPVALRVLLEASRAEMLRRARVEGAHESACFWGIAAWCNMACLSGQRCTRPWVLTAPDEKPEAAKPRRSQKRGDGASGGHPSGLPLWWLVSGFVGGVLFSLLW